MKSTFHWPKCLFGLQRHLFGFCRLKPLRVFPWRSSLSSSLPTGGSGIKSKFACILEASESTRNAYGRNLYRKYHEGPYRRKKEDNSLQHYNLVHEIYFLWWLKNRRKLEKVFGVGTKGQEKNLKWLVKQEKKGRKSTLRLIDGTSVIWRMPKLEDKSKKYKGRVVTPRRHCGRWFWDLMQYSQSKDHEHDKWRPAKKSWRIISRLPGLCRTSGPDAVICLHPSKKRRDAPKDCFAQFP